MNCVLHGLTGQINTEHYPQDIKVTDILPSTVHTVAATTSDLRRVYNFEQDAIEFQKIFNNSNIRNCSVDSSSELNESMYIPDGDGSDIDCNDFINADDFEDFKDNNNHKEKDRNHHKKKKKRDKNDKEARQHPIGLTVDDNNENQNSDTKTKGKEKRNKDKSKIKKKKEKDNDKNKDVDLDKEIISADPINNDGTEVISLIEV